jgi:hypothetical protein
MISLYRMIVTGILQVYEDSVTSWRLPSAAGDKD